ncbi:hypothetical protein CK203_005987 [Vitis vinifera]|uniref:Uncharacterized protein n=1 Tax=Vitis vinifera TaxID=29760 RepID=A0A438K6B1_VITVI|nr:hypothetical protein CK203_005987 [Vitis vinifera]
MLRSTLLVVNDVDISASVEEKKQAAADVLFQYSKFVMACIGNQVRPCDLRLHLMKVIWSVFCNFLDSSSSNYFSFLA